MQIHIQYDVCFAGLRVWDELIGPVDIIGGLLWCLPMVIAMLVTVSITERFPELIKIKRLLQKTIVPLLHKMPTWVH